jgi:hypothetical protein
MGSVEGEKKCFVMICNDKTEGICIREKIMGTVKTREEYLEGIEEGTEGLLWNYNSEVFLGLAKSPGIGVTSLIRGGAQENSLILYSLG